MSWPVPFYHGQPEEIRMPLSSSQWPEFIPLSYTDAPTLARAIFDNWCCRYGTPDRLHRDEANNVHGHVM